MYIQMLSFKAHAASTELKCRYFQSVALAIGEFPGLASTQWFRSSTDGAPGERVVLVARWASADALDDFRKSDVYARFVLSPIVGHVHDSDYAQVLGDELTAAQPAGLLAA